MRFTIRDLLWLTVIAAGSVVFGLKHLRADNVEEYAVTFAIFLVATTVYIAFAVMWRLATKP